MLHHTAHLANAAALYAFVDSNFLHNKRPAIPGGAWPVESLSRKSLADLQEIWMTLLRERNMLSTMKEHYLKHQEELGAMPAPSRLQMVEESMDNIKRVVKERDAEATAEAARIFKERLAKGRYRYPPGPPPPPGAHDSTSTVKLTLSRRVEPERLKELLGFYNVYEPHHGIVKIELQLPIAVLQQKQDAEQLWQHYRAQVSDVKEYYKWLGSSSDDTSASLYDYAQVELAPGVWTGSATEDAGAAEDVDGSAEASPTPLSTIRAAALSVPPPRQRPPPPRNPLEHIRLQRRSTLSKAIIQLGYFPNTTLTPPQYADTLQVPRPTHPDEIEGPWEAWITYDSKNGLTYVQSLGLTRIDGAEVLSVEEVQPAAPQPFAAVDPVYQEAVRQEMAAEETQMKWPNVPEWKYEYDTYTKKHLSEVVQYNYSNVVDYIDREVLLTGRSVWTSPIDIDYTCGGMKSVPAHAKKPRRYMNHGISEVGVTDI